MESRSDAKLFNICNLTKIKMSTAMKLNVFFFSGQGRCVSHLSTPAIPNIRRKSRWC
jgi:hypothetical protein